MSDSTSYLKTESVNFKEIKKITQYEEQSENRLKHFQKPVGQYNGVSKEKRVWDRKIFDERWLKISQI